MYSGQYGDRKTVKRTLLKDIKTLHENTRSTLIKSVRNAATYYLSCPWNKYQNIYSVMLRLTCNKRPLRGPPKYPHAAIPTDTANFVSQRF